MEAGANCFPVEGKDAPEGSSDLPKVAGQESTTCTAVACLITWTCPLQGTPLTYMFCWQREGVRMPRSKPPYRPQFRLEAVRLLKESGRPVSCIAAELGVRNATS